MAFCRLVFPLLVLSVICINATKVPVYVWGDLPQTPLKSNALTTVSTPEFESILGQELADDPLTIVFIEKTLSVEDFSRRDDQGEIAFPFLQSNIKNAIYLPSVENAYRALNQLAKPSVADHIKLTENGLSEEISPKTEDSGKFVFINFEDAVEGESRAKMLQRHDDFMQKTVSEMKQKTNVVAVYTAHYPSWTIPVTHSRVRREVTSSNGTYLMEGLRLYASSINIMTGNDSFALKDFTTATTQYGEGANNMTTKMDFNNGKITLELSSKGGYWFFDSVLLELPANTDKLTPVEEVFAILGFSYRCSHTVSFTGANETIVFKDMKIQPFFETANKTQEFGDSFNCVGFFTAPIWAGLFVVFILLLITFYGIMMMMDIRTMDRFDDPKGKTITINAAE